jgi:hypothetical protein
MGAPPRWTAPERREAQVIPVILRACGWRDAPFSKLDPLPTGGRPVTDADAWPTRDDAFKNVADGVAAALRALPQTPAAPSTAA